MQKGKRIELTADFDLLPIGSWVWKFKKTKHLKEIEVISVLHNTSHYPLDNFYKPISKTINFDEE